MVMNVVTPPRISVRTVVGRHEKDGADTFSGA
jgi:hypothetical protein